MKDYSSLTTRIMIQLEPELSQEFHNMLTDMAKEISRLYEIEKAKPSEALECLEDIYRNAVFVKKEPQEMKSCTAHWKLFGESHETHKTISEQCNTIKQALHKLKQYDDLMGKYNIKNIKELEKILERDRFNSIGKSIQYCKNEVIK